MGANVPESEKKIKKFIIQKPSLNLTLILWRHGGNHVLNQLLKRQLALKCYNYLSCLSQKTGVANVVEKTQIICISSMFTGSLRFLSRIGFVPPCGSGAAAEETVSSLCHLVAKRRNCGGEKKTTEPRALNFC